MMNVEYSQIEQIAAPTEKKEVEKVSENEVETVLDQMKRGKAVGSNEVLVEACKVLELTGSEEVMLAFHGKCHENKTDAS